jgi:phosphoribosylformylglycinamidine synthase
MIRERLVASAHDCSEGGLACALAEAALGDGSRPLGVSVTLDDDLRPVACLFGEAQGRIVLSCAPGSTDAVLATATRHGVPARKIGSVRGPADTFDVTVQGASISAALDETATAYFDSLANRMASTPTGS